MDRADDFDDDHPTVPLRPARRRAEEAFADQPTRVEPLRIVLARPAATSRESQGRGRAPATRRSPRAAQLFVHAAIVVAAFSAGMFFVALMRR